jgi:DNA-directed RNA polymerase subunit RPC12/RpoP
VVAATLKCPRCGETFDFAAWSSNASCPHCGARVRFEEAAAAGAAGGAAAGGASSPGAAEAGTPAPASSPAAPAVAPVSAPLPSAPPTERTFFGKPLRWTRGWSIVVVVWVLAAVALAVVRVEMGQLTVLSPRERDAISHVERGHLQLGVTYGQALVLVLARMGASAGTPTWYVQDRPWEHRVYVDWQLGADVLSWGVSYGGQVTPSPQTALILKEFERAGPAPQTPALPGL